MFECNELIHPFQNDPGVSQQQRVMDDLLSGSPKIDGRSMADLLNYFVQLSPHVNYYDAGLQVSDWQPFFQKSIPFALTAIIKFDRNAVSEKISEYNTTFNRHPSKAGLQLLLHYIFQKVISRINTWHLQVKDSGLPAELIIEKLIKDKLQAPLKKFVCTNNVAVKYYCVKPVDFSRLAANEVWALDLNIKNENEDCRPIGKSKRKRLIALRGQIRDLLPSFLDAVRIIAGTAEQSIEQSLFPLKEELQKKHTPHLALLFAFLKLFQHLQGDLNKYTKKHLDFFYKQVLKLNAREAVPDKAHIVFEIQKQLDSYLLKKGLLVKDGKDTKKAEILFSLDDEIVVNKTQVTDKRTLFLNNQNIFEHGYIEGVYMAPNADKADGLTKDFKDNDSKSFATTGAKLSKYTDPEKTLARPYPNARIGFILASPVLLLNEGTRTIDISLACRLGEDYCDEMEDPQTRASGNCCEERIPGTTVASTTSKKKYPDFIDAPGFYNDVATALNETWYYISEDIIVESSKKGISKELEKKLRGFLTEIQTKSNSKTVCYCPVEIKKYEAVLRKTEWDAFYGTANASEKKILDELMKPRKALKVSFSGAKEWIEPKINITPPSPISIIPSVFSGDEFVLKINVALEADQPAVTYYDKEKLKEDFNTTMPLVKIELDDKIKLSFTNGELEEKIKDRGQVDDCCLLKKLTDDSHQVSLYHFFRNVIVIDEVNTEKTRIDVTVCGLKNFIVQNNESVLDVNGPVYPFGTRPEIIDFDVVNPAKPPLTNPNLIGPDFYVGSKEVFCKKWNSVRINLNWKDKPSNFREYYKAYVVEDVALQIFGLDEDKFAIRLSSLQNGIWSEEAADRKLFDVSLPAPLPPLTADIPAPCAPDGTYTQGILLNPSDFPGQVNQPFAITNIPDEAYTVNTKFGFIKINLRNQDFLHKDYGYVLARQMMALGKFPKEGLEGAVYLKNGNTVIVFESIAPKLVELDDLVNDTKTATGDTKSDVIQIRDRSNQARLAGSDEDEKITDAEFTTNPDISTPIQNAVTDSDDADDFANDTQTKLAEIKSSLSIFDLITGKLVDNLAVPIPNEPWTPIIKNISLDYTATATATDIDFIHLYPYDGTYKAEEITLEPTLFPTFCDEGTLFIGLKELQPGSNVNMLFQLAEATADSEADREEVTWYYLDNNQWKILRTGFEVLDDATDGLTTSGVVKFALPENMTKDNSILPKGLHWIKATFPKNSITISETMGIYTQAIRATFTNEAANDKLRLSGPLEAGKVSKLNEADANVKKLMQPYDSFGGRLPEAEGHFYVRVSELLRHKGRAIQKFDYERLVLEAFPRIFKVKCVNHSFALDAHQYKNDFPVAPGYVLLAVIPDLNQLKAGQSFEPRVPVSMLDDIQEYCKRHTSPFVRFRAMNPRYEKVHFCLKIKLVAGKDENYYKEKLKQDLREFMAPWAIGEYDKLRFGQCVGRSEVIRFLETRDYADHIIELLMRHDENDWPDKTNEKKLSEPVCPKTPRSILIAGEIDVCIPEKDCEEWGKCYNVQGQEIDCCDSKKIPIADYCLRDVIG